MNRPAAEPPAADTDADAGAASSRFRRRARFEVIFTIIWLAVGLLAMPALIYAVGGALLGPYGENSGLGRFYGDFFGDLGEPSVRAWSIALGPLVLISILRLIFAGAGEAPNKPREQDRPPPARRSSEDQRRVEPSVSTE